MILYIVYWRAQMLKRSYIKDKAMNKPQDNSIMVIAVGFKFRGYAPEDARSHTLSLVPEPDNEYDSDAIKLMRHVDG